ncbi:hypothetical protein MKW92_040840, partial [Papaver armeniacum]
MATSAIQRSAFAGQTALKQQNEFIRKVGNVEGGRISMRRTVKKHSIKHVVITQLHS